jgi:hypothetical protein
MAEITTLKALTGYFNSGDNKKPLREFSEELKALTPEEKAEMGAQAAAAMGDSIKAPLA